MRNENEGTVPEKVKIGPKIVDCMFIGYATNIKACWLMIHKSKPSDSHVKGLNDLGKNQRKMYLIKRMSMDTSFEFNFGTFFLKMII